MPQSSKPAVAGEIASIIRQTSPGLAERIAEQERALQEVSCTDPHLGNWLEASDMSWLRSVFALEDADFAPRFPYKKFTKPERERFIADLEAHVKECLRCSLKCKYDDELNEQIEAGLAQNAESLSRLVSKQ